MGGGVSIYQKHLPGAYEIAYIDVLNTLDPLPFLISDGGSLVHLIHASFGISLFRLGSVAVVIIYSTISFVVALVAIAGNTGSPSQTPSPGPASVGFR